jgi:hypothetical protein
MGDNERLPVVMLVMVIVVVVTIVFEVMVVNIKQNQSRKSDSVCTWCLLYSSTVVVLVDFFDVAPHALGGC